MLAGQAQKEAFVNEALAIVDGITHAAIEGVLTSPPASPGDGKAWLIGSTATGAWTGHSEEVVLRQNGQWLFVTPREGMRLLNASTGQDMRRVGNIWRTPDEPNAPSGGTVVDSEARAALGELIAALRQAGVFAL